MFDEETSISRSAVNVLIAAFLVISVTPAVHELVSRPQPTLLARIAEDRRRFGFEAAVQEVERHLIFDSQFAGALRQRYQTLLVEVFRKGSRTVFVGPDKSLVHQSDIANVSGLNILSARFLAEPPRGVDIVDAAIRKLRSPWKRVPPPARLPPYAHSLNVLSSLNRQLQQRGLHLVLVVVPTKLTIYPERWSPGYPVAAGPAWNAGYAEWRERLRANDVDVVDLSDVFWQRRADPEPFFLKYDTHWAPHGVSVGADVVADRVRPFLRDAPRVDVDLARRAIVEPSDLRSLLGLRTDTRVFPLSTVDIDGVRAVGDDTKATGDEAHVLVFGDSLTGYYDQDVDAEGRRAGFARQLMARLHVGVQRFVGFGARLPEVIQEVFSTHPHALDRKDVVVLEIAIGQLYARNFSAEFAVPPAAAR